MGEIQDAVAADLAASGQLENFEGLSAQEAGQKLARLYKVAKANDVLTQHAQAERQAKLTAQSTTGSSSRQSAPTGHEQAVADILKANQTGAYRDLIRRS